MSYYPPSPHSSMHGHQPVMYSSSHQPYGNGYLSPQPQYGDGHGYAGAPYVVSSTSSRSRHHSQPHRHSSRRSHSRHGHGHSHGRHHTPHHHRRHRSLGERILSWFGIGRHRSHRRSKKGWSFFGNNRNRSRYVDARTGGEVDRLGRRVYKV